MFKRKSTYIIIGLVLIFVFFFKTSRAFLYKISSDFLYPFHKIMLVFKSSKNVSYSEMSKRHLINELVKQRKINEELAAKCNYLESKVKENRELRKLLKLKTDTKQYKYIYAQIVNRTPAVWFTQFVIDKGSDDGVTNGSLVVSRINSDGVVEDSNSELGVIGRVRYVSKHTSLVQTIINDECRLSVKIPNNGANGILEGGGHKGSEFWVNLTYLPRDFAYENNSIVKTSGLTDMTPPDIVVGYLVYEKPEDIINVDNLYLTAKVKTAVNLNNLNFLLVLTVRK